MSFSISANVEHCCSCGLGLPKLSPSQKEVKDLLDKGKLSCNIQPVITMDITQCLEVINSKTIVAMQRKGLVGDWEIKTQIVK